MANGKPGDHPINDICDHKQAVYSPKVDELIQKIHGFLPRYRMWDLFDWSHPPPMAEFEILLQTKLDELENEARGRGWESQ